jgi:hypothetical protein
MKRFLTAAALVLAAPVPVLAQDMPLSQILIDGEGWKKVEGKSEKPKEVKIENVDREKERKGPYDITFPSGKKFRVEALPNIFWRHGDAWLALKHVPPAAALLTPDGGTLYVGGEEHIALYAYRVDKDGKATARAGYARLRLPQVGPVGVTALSTDKDGRIYAATELGIQVFDPTGRLCGVMTAPEGEADLMIFEGDRLTLWIGDTKYARKLNTQGAK